MTRQRSAVSSQKNRDHTFRNRPLSLKNSMNFLEDRLIFEKHSTR
jgi:hypothetical protein